MQTPFEMAWLILKNYSGPVSGRTPRYDIHSFDVNPTNFGQPSLKPPKPPSESYADKIKRLMAEDEARSTYQDLPPPSNTFDLGNMEPYTKLGQPSSPPTPSV